jgi:hypothetical protein
MIPLTCGSFGVWAALGESFAVFGEDHFWVFVEGLFAAPTADVVGLVSLWVIWIVPLPPVTTHSGSPLRQPAACLRGFSVS